MTTKGEWVAYTGSDEQIAELQRANCGYALRLKSGTEVLSGKGRAHHRTDYGNGKDIVAYWIIPDDPLREMKIRHAMTGQPVWIRHIKDLIKLKPTDKGWRKEIIVTTTPDWNIPNAEYSFTAFEE